MLVYQRVFFPLGRSCGLDGLEDPEANKKHVQHDTVQYANESKAPNGSENGVYSQWNSHLVGIMISKTIGCRDTLFSDKAKLQHQ